MMSIQTWFFFFFWRRIFLVFLSLSAKNLLKHPSRPASIQRLLQKRTSASRRSRSSKIDLKRPSPSKEIDDCFVDTFLLLFSSDLKRVSSLPLLYITQAASQRLVIHVHLAPWLKTPSRGHVRTSTWSTLFVCDFGRLQNANDHWGARATLQGKTGANASRHSTTYIVIASRTRTRSWSLVPQAIRLRKQHSKIVFSLLLVVL